LTSEARDGRSPAGGTVAVDTAIPVADLRFVVEPHNCFACGSLNSNGLQLDLHVQGERCWTELSLPVRFQGWDGIAHGGIVCTILDEVMAWALVFHDNLGLTARMSVEFKRPIELGRPFRAEGWVTESHRRILRTAARIVDVERGDLLATAEGTYVAAGEARKRELKDRYGFRLVETADR
jgi:acyl-coenzyme A thioesterase PaaI-like protein